MDPWAAYTIPPEYAPYLKYTCSAFYASGSMWPYCPSPIIAVSFTCLYAATFFVHIYQAYIFRCKYATLVILSAFLQTVGFALRIASIRYPSTEVLFLAWYVMLAATPVFTNAFIYQVFGRMLEKFRPDPSLRKVCSIWFMPPMLVSFTFVFLDLAALGVQAYSASRASNARHQNINETLKWLHVYQAGVGMQQLWLFLFLFFAIALLHILRQVPPRIKNDTQGSIRKFIAEIKAVEKEWDRLVDERAGEVVQYFGQIHGIIDEHNARYTELCADIEARKKQAQIDCEPEDLDTIVKNIDFDYRTRHHDGLLETSYSINGWVDKINAVADSRSKRLRSVKILIYVLFVILALISARNMFRIGEYWFGIDSPSLHREDIAIYADSTLMLAVLILLNIAHPGMLLNTSDINWTSERIYKFLCCVMDCRDDARKRRPGTFHPSYRDDNELYDDYRDDIDDYMYADRFGYDRAFPNVVGHSNKPPSYRSEGRGHFSSSHWLKETEKHETRSQKSRGSRSHSSSQARKDSTKLTQRRPASTQHSSNERLQRHDSFDVQSKTSEASNASNASEQMRRLNKFLGHDD